MPLTTEGCVAAASARFGHRWLTSGSSRYAAAVSSITGGAGITSNRLASCTQLLRHAFSAERRSARR